MKRAKYIKKEQRKTVCRKCGLKRLSITLMGSEDILFSCTCDRKKRQEDK